MFFIGRRPVPKNKVNQIKGLLRAKQKMKDIAKKKRVSITKVSKINKESGIRSAHQRALSARERKFVERALSLAKYTPMTKIAKRVGVTSERVRQINKEKGIRGKLAIRVGRRSKLSGKKFEAVVGMLASHPEIPFTEIAKQFGVWPTDVTRINKSIKIQDRWTILERISRIRGGPKKPRPRLFSPQEKWKIIQSSTPYLLKAITNASKYADIFPRRIRVPAEEILQEAKLEAFGALDLVETREHPERYIGAVARIMTIKYIKREAKRLGISPEVLERITTRKKMRGQ